jgi:hypothetical protein
VRNHDASSVVVAGRTAGGLAAALQGQLARLRLGATTWGAWDEAHPGAGLALDAPARAWALSRADRWAGWDWEHQTGLSVATGAGPREIAFQVATEEATPALCWQQPPPLLHQHVRSEIARRLARFSVEYPGQEQAKSAQVFAAQGMVRAREFDFAPRRKERRGRG